MTEVVQDQQAIDQVAEGLAGEIFDRAQEEFVGKLRALSPEAVDTISEATAKLRGTFTPEAAKEVRELKETATEESLRSALEKVAAMRGHLDGEAPAVQVQVIAKKIMDGYNRDHETGVIELTLPKELKRLAQERGTTAIQLAGQILNAAAKENNMEYPVFDENQAEFWAKNEANSDLQTKPGKAYQFKLLTESASKTRAEQEKQYGEGAPLGAIAIAEACELLNTENQHTLFKHREHTLFKHRGGYKVWVRGSAPGVALFSDPSGGVGVNGCLDVPGLRRVAFAPVVPPRSKARNAQIW